MATVYSKFHGVVCIHSVLNFCVLFWSTSCRLQDSCSAERPVLPRYTVAFVSSSRIYSSVEFVIHSQFWVLHSERPVSSGYGVTFVSSFAII